MKGKLQGLSYFLSPLFFCLSIIGGKKEKKGEKSLSPNHPQPPPPLLDDHHHHPSLKHTTLAIPWEGNDDQAGGHVDILWGRGWGGSARGWWWEGSDVKADSMWSQGRPREKLQTIIWDACAGIWGLPECPKDSGAFCCCCRAHPIIAIIPDSSLWEMSLPPCYLTSPLGRKKWSHLSRPGNAF